MEITYLHIKNFKSIKDLEINDIENAMILVGKNSTGKTAVIDAICAASGDYQVKETNFLQPKMNVTIEINIQFT